MPRLKLTPAVMADVMERITEGERIKAIARSLDVTAGTLHTTLYRARKYGYKNGGWYELRNKQLHAANASR